ncbi:MAG: DNA mismatch repair protein MutS [Termitinemataceae bacterium]|nr:MAG: DNA mismatch repair protein MutS [Termitinemataceae bacterium]
MSERLKDPVLKTGEGAIPPRVRIPPAPRKLHLGEMREWLNRAVSKTVMSARTSRVRIPLSPLILSMTESISPMQMQYRRIKALHREEVLFFRLGDFYEMFADDAIEVSQLLNLTLTHRNNLPMCGIPYHSCRSYIARLLKHGKKVAICEQVAGVSAGKTLLDREVTEIITPATTLEDDFLEKGSSNYLACLYNTGTELSFAYIELSSGDFCATTIGLSNAESKIRQELERIDVKEIIVQESLFTDLPAIAFVLQNRSDLLVNRWMDWVFDIEKYRNRLLQQFDTENLKCFGLNDSSPQIFSAGALLTYIDEMAKGLIPHICKLIIYDDGEFLGLDESSSRNLEIIRNLKDGDTGYTLLEVCDQTKTAMGRRLLKHRLTHPLMNIAKIQNRLDAVNFFFDNDDKRASVRSILAVTPDIERQRARLAMDKSNGKDLLSLKNALASLDMVYAVVFDDGALNKRTVDSNTDKKRCRIPVFESSEAAAFSGETLSTLNGLQKLLDDALFEDPSILFNEGKLIKRGYNADLDGLHELHSNGRSLLQAYLEEEKQSTGITTLKIQYNRLIGYFFEVTNTHAVKVPEYFIKRQGLVNAQRYSTERLASLESEINGAQDKIVELERSLFFELRASVKKHIAQLSAAAALLAEIDTAAALAEAARLYRWAKPAVNEGGSLHIVQGRHPVVEAHTGRGGFIPNDVVLSTGAVPVAALTDLGGVNKTVSGTDSNDHGGALTSTAGGSEKHRKPCDSKVEGFVARGAVPPANIVSDNASFMLITGPNMAGKSTYLRQTALITLMAQAGSYVPAHSAEIGIVDRIYCRVGASDNLARGESTFFVEMSETAYILNTATARSLVIMDEVGRGTSAKDGLAIAQAVCEYLLDTVKCRTLFATHYHELTKLSHPHMINCSLKVVESGGEIVFLRKLVFGAASGSYGLHVARIAGITASVLERSAVLLAQIEDNERNFKSQKVQGTVKALHGTDKQKETKKDSSLNLQRDLQPLLF